MIPRPRTRTGGRVSAIARQMAGLRRPLAGRLDLPGRPLWLYQPLDCSELLYRDPGAARRAFAYTGEYARSLTNDPVEGFAFFEESPELSRRFRQVGFRTQP